MPDPPPPSPSPSVVKGRALLFVGLLLCWHPMLLVHELGHAAAAWATGLRVTELHLPLLGFSHTHVNASPRPLAVVAAGPLLGTAIPLLLTLLIAPRQRRIARWLRIFAGFCCVANGAYLAAGTLDHIGDVAELLDAGVPAALLITLGTLALIAGLTLWHTLGTKRRNSPPG